MAEISDNLLSAYLDGNVTAEEAMLVIDTLHCDEQLQEFMEWSAAIDADFDKPKLKVLPMTAMAAATNDKANQCAMLCELYVLKKCGVERSVSDWEKQARNQGWLKDNGMALYNIGRLLEQECFSTRRTFHNTLDDISKALKNNEHVIAIVDHDELTSDMKKIEWERVEDEVVGKTPDHAIVIEFYDATSHTISYYDPAIKDKLLLSISEKQFLDAWDDSSNYLVIISQRNLSEYIPHPIDLSDVELSDDIEDLREAIAENAHEVWAEGRKALGWTYGPTRNDQLKQTPDMVPYSDLTDEEKSFDREMAMNTIKLLKKLGYDIVKANDSFSR